MLIKENQKIIQIFLSADEKNNDVTRRYAESICDDYFAKGYTAVIFLSGSRDLASATSDLLLSNKKKLSKNFER